MYKEIKRTEKYSLAKITPEDCQTASVVITADVHSKKTLSDQAAQLLYSDLLLSGTKNQTRDQFISAVNTLGASIKVSVCNGKINLNLKATSQAFPKLLKLVEEMLLKPAFASKEMARAKNTTVNELEEEKQNSNAIAHQNLLNGLYQKGDSRHSFGLNSSIKEIKKTNVNAVKMLHSDNLNSYWNCSVASNKVNADRLEKFLRKVKNEYEVEARQGYYAKQKQPKSLHLENVPSRQNIDFSIGSNIPFTLHHPDYVPLNFAVAVLANWGGFAGRLMSTVREKEGLTYTIYGCLEGFSGDTEGNWRIMTFFAPEQAIQGLQSTFREILKLYQKGITADELERFKTILHTRQVLLKDSLTGQLKDLHAYNCHGFTIQEMEEHKAKLNDLTRAEVNQTIKKYLNPKNLTISAAGPIKNVEKDLEKFSKNLR